MRPLRLFIIAIVLAQILLASVPQTHAEPALVTIPDKQGVSTAVDTVSGAITLDKWAKESSLSLTLRGAKPTGKTTTADKTTLLYESGYKQEIVALSDGIELNVVLAARPASNIWVWDIDSKGLAFYYQPPLDLEPKEANWDKVNATHALDKDGNVVAYRPIDVVGSYAVYGDKKDNEYGTGKVAHIYRPLAIDAKGASTWGTLIVDDKGKSLSVSIDGKWLDEAAYPVVVDPRLGYDTAGASWGDLANAITGYIWTMPANGYGISMSAYCLIDNAGSQNMKMGLYKHSDLSLTGYTAQASVTSTTGAWYSANISGSPPYLTSGETYLLVAWAPLASPFVSVALDSGTAGYGHQKSAAYGDFPNPLVTPSHLSNKYSIYLTYLNAYTITASAGDHGTIAPAGVTTLMSGSSQAYTITPELGYMVEDLFVDGVSVGSSTSYTFTGVTANHIITASFSIPIDFGGIYEAIGLLAVGLIVLAAVCVLAVSKGNIDPSIAAVMLGFAVAVIIGTYVLASIQAAIL